MLKRRKKKAKVPPVGRQILFFAGKIAFIILAFFLFYYFVGSFQRHSTEVAFPIPDVTEQENVSLTEIFPSVANFQTCIDTRSSDDFLYADEAQISTEPEQKPYVYENALAESVFYQKLEELEAQEPETAEDAFTLPAQPSEGGMTALSALTEPSNLDKFYEEELPDDVIVEDFEETPVSPELLASGYHIYERHKNIKEMDVLPNYKPPYFGEVPVIAVVIDDMGVSQKRTRDITSLQAPLTASFLTYGRNLEPQVQNALNAGQEVMVHTPMQAHSDVDTAPDVLTVDMSVEEIKSGLNTMLDKFHGIKGINNHMGSRLTEDFERMDAVMQVLKERGLFFLDSKTTAFSMAKKAARLNGVAYATRHVFLDNENNVDYINKQLDIAERIARRNGYAVAIGHPKTGTYKALKDWLSQLEEKKIKLVPLSHIVDVLHKSHI